MKKPEVARLLDFARECYPGFNCKSEKAMLDVWTDMLGHVSFADGMAAMKKACQKSKYFPSIADVIAEIKADVELTRGYLK